MGSNSRNFFARLCLARPASDTTAGTRRTCYSSSEKLFAGERVLTLARRCRGALPAHSATEVALCFCLSMQLRLFLLYHCRLAVRVPRDVSRVSTSCACRDYVGLARVGIPTLFSLTMSYSSPAVYTHCYRHYSSAAENSRCETNFFLAGFGVVMRASKGVDAGNFMGTSAKRKAVRERLVSKVNVA